jgi:hypothetical protein
MNEKISKLGKDLRAIREEILAEERMSNTDNSDTPKPAESGPLDLEPPTEMTPDEFIARCLTVADLIKALSELPQDAIVVKFAGGDCDGYVPIAKREFKEVVMYLRSSWNTWEYHGEFDDVEGRRDEERFRRKYKDVKKLKYIKNVKAVKL